MCVRWHIRVFILLKVLICVLSLEIPLTPVENHEPVEYFTLEQTSVRNCYCDRNQVWKNGLCINYETSVNYIVSYYPTFLQKEVKTEEIKNVTIQNLTCESFETLIALKDVSFKPDSILFHLESGESFSEYCLQHVFDADRNLVTEAKVCLKPTQMPSCCLSNQVLDPISFKCLESKIKLARFYPQLKLAKEVIEEPFLQTYLQPIPQCGANNELEIQILKNDMVTLQYKKDEVAEALLFQWEEVRERIYPQSIHFPSEFCIGQLQPERKEIANDNFGEDPNEKSQYIAVVWDDWVTYACENSSLALKESPDICEDAMYWVILPLLAISTVFLILILIVHISMAELRKSLAGKISFCHVLSLLVAFCMLLILHIPQEFNCKIYGPLVQISFLGAFFWLNVMCFDIWRKLRSGNPPGNSLNSSQKQRFIVYSIYAWGLPLVIGIITIIIDNVEHNSWIVSPGFGDRTCWFADRQAALVYYFGIVGVLMIANLVFFVWVCVVLIKAQRTYNQVLKNSPMNNDRSWIYLRVFSMMGVTWVCEYLSWQEGTCRYWIMTDIINSLRGFVMFVILFGNRKSVAKMQEKFALLNTSVHRRVSQSVDSLRKLSLKPHLHSDSGLDSRRTSETTVELTNRIRNQDPA